MEDRKVLCGILFVLYTGIQWEWLPSELGFGSGMTCWRRLRDWNNAIPGRQAARWLLSRGQRLGLGRSRRFGRTPSLW
ncbi:hypothetical protein GCM10010211_46000 [Streptomyces albospinus]|uniref:Insertion element IS402-like domain-containing protein n=1 Tax=Streptomyces albospinus TaxID=285515 RepID=A0ABQ2VCT7_9ACTN|nr:hypothetical protein GCM10010211_46000 [Streptomyces albospinus]